MMGKFKVGDRVRRIRCCNGGDVEIGDTGTVVKVESDGDVYVRNDADGEDYYHMTQYLESVAVATQPQPLRIEAGRYYKTRDGRKVGPMVSGRGPWFEDDRGYSYYENGKRLANVYGDEIIAEWTDEPVASNADIFDELEEWMADNPLPVIANSTTGFTVPLDAPEFGGGGAAEFKVGDRVHYKDAYCEGVGVIHSDNDAANGYGWFVTVEENDRDHAPFNDNTTRIFTEDKLRLVAEATSGKLEATAPTMDDLCAAELMVRTGVCTINEVRKHLGLGPVPHGHELARAA